MFSLNVPLVSFNEKKLIIINKGDSKFHYMILLVVYKCIVNDIDCTTHIFFIPWLDNDLPEWISNWKPLWSKLKIFSETVR